MHDLIFFWLPAFPLAFKIFWSYYIRHQSVVKNICYGSTQKLRNYLDVYPGKNDSPVIIFIHGGAWGFNGKLDHHLIGSTLQSKGFSVVLPNYSRHPYGNVEDMVHDLDEAVHWTLTNIDRYKGNSSRVYLLGHSAGAHLISMTLLEKAWRTREHTLLLETEPSPSTAWTGKNISGVLLLSGVYDIREHYKYESWRSVEDLSPMKPAMRGQAHFAQYSPTTILDYCITYDNSWREVLLEHMPPMKILHAKEDTTVPAKSSIDFFANLQQLGVRDIELHLLPTISHIGFAFGLMGGKDEFHLSPFLDSLK